jgi:uncharacterized membrane protein
VRIRVRALVDQARGSLFFVPMVLVLAGAALGQLMVSVDAGLGGTADDLPFVLTSTVDSAREVLGVVAGATITFAGIAFSVSLLVFQQASSQYSPRIVHSLFRDPFNRRVMGVVVGTFAYCLIVLRAVRSAIDEGGEPVVPNLSVNLAVLLGVVAILTIVAFIDHNAHSMEVSRILDRVAQETADQIARTWAAGSDAVAVDRTPPTGDGQVVEVRSSGWIQQIDEAALMAIVPTGGTLRLATAAGRFVLAGTPLATIWPRATEPEDADAVVADAVQVGPVRTMLDDPTYGIRQLADVALVALSPGRNDPTTAEEAIFQLARVLGHALAAELPPVASECSDRRRIIRDHPPSPTSLLSLAYEQISRAAHDHPSVLQSLATALSLVHGSLLSAGLADRAETVAHAARSLTHGARPGW